MSDWTLFDDEVARWRDAGHEAELWWRDDDAVDVGPALDRLLQVHRETTAPLALAVVPAQATATLAARLADEPMIDVLQHGYAHVNHAGPTEKKMELGLQRPAMVVLGDLGTGWMALERLFGPKALPVLVPPWNRIAPPLVPTLPEIGFRGLSTFGVRKRADPVRGLRQINTHVLVDAAPADDIEHDRRQVLDALAAGHCFVAYDGAAPARGFRFSANSDRGTVLMGDEVVNRSGLTLQAAAPSVGSLRLLRDGVEIGRWENQSHCSHTVPIGEFGVYRIEIHVIFKGHLRGWIYSNPIYVRAPGG